MQMHSYRLFSSLGGEPFSPKYAEIDLAALRHNYQALRAHLCASAPCLRPIAVVKADAYGHGAPFCVAALLAEGCDFFAVSSLEEAIAVRRTCQEENKAADVLILGYTAPRYAPLLIEHELTQALLSYDHAIALAAAAKDNGGRLRTHIALDTGMGRVGFGARTDEEIAHTADEITALLQNKALELCGAFTHFASADCNDERGRAQTDLQAARYRAVRAALDARGAVIPFHHACNSAAALSRHEELFDGVRLGIVLYGAAQALHKTLPLRPVMRLCAEVVHVQTLPCGESVGYGARFTATKETRIAVLPIGYADGLPRSLRASRVTLYTPSGIRTAPVVGNVCMDQCMIDVTDTDAAVGTRAVFFGDTAEQLSALSAHAKTIDYELLCAVSARVPRLYRTEGFDIRSFS